MSVVKASGVLYLQAFTAEGLNDPQGSNALKEQLTERAPLDACLNDFFSADLFSSFFDF